LQQPDDASADSDQYESLEQDNEKDRSKHILEAIGWTSTGLLALANGHHDYSTHTF